MAWASVRTSSCYFPTSLGLMMCILMMIGMMRILIRILSGILVILMLYWYQALIYNVIHFFLLCFKFRSFLSFNGFSKLSWFGLKTNDCQGHYIDQSCKGKEHISKQRDVLGERNITGHYQKEHHNGKNDCCKKIYSFPCANRYKVIAYSEECN